MAILKRLRRFALCALLLTPALGAPVASEYQVKAVFLYNFSRFVEWPREAFASENAPFVVGIFGHDPFGRELEEAVKGELVMAALWSSNACRVRPRRPDARSCSSTSPKTSASRKRLRRSATAVRSP